MESVGEETAEATPEATPEACAMAFFPDPVEEMCDAFCWDDREDKKTEKDPETAAFASALSKCTQKIRDVFTSINLDVDIIRDAPSTKAKDQDQDKTGKGKNKFPRQRLRHHDSTLYFYCLKCKAADRVSIVATGTTCVPSKKYEQEIQKATRSLNSKELKDKKNGDKRASKESALETAKEKLQEIKTRKTMCCSVKVDRLYFHDFECCTERSKQSTAGVYEEGPGYEILDLPGVLLDDTYDKTCKKLSKRKVFTKGSKVGAPGKEINFGVTSYKFEDRRYEGLPSRQYKEIDSRKHANFLLRLVYYFASQMNISAEIAVMVKDGKDEKERENPERHLKLTDPSLMTGGHSLVKSKYDICIVTSC